MPIQELDLTKRAPRSPRVRLGGYAILPRMLDKGRATLAGKNGEFTYNCPLDQQFTSFVGIDADQLKRQLALGKGDGEILDWITSNATFKRSPAEIELWSGYQDRRCPTDLEMRKFFNEYHAQVAPNRKDVGTWFDILDIDDYVSFGGKA
jgi:hypothetical protein